MPLLSAKKKLSQHFLRNKSDAEKIASYVSGHGNYQQLLEIGPGTGMLTEALLALPYRLHAVELDPRAVPILRKRFGERLTLWQEDVLNMQFEERVSDCFGLVGNLPYGISSSILFKLLAAREQVPEAVILLQEEVARRLAAKPGSRQYGLLSVLLQTYYNVKYCLFLPQSAFSPPPKVQSGLLQLQRLPPQVLSCRHVDLVRITKKAFGQRRKMLRNALAAWGEKIPEIYAEKRAEQLSVDDFIHLTTAIC